MGGIDERDPSAPSLGEQWLPRHAMQTQLREVTSPELGPPLGVVPEPTPQPRTRRNVFRPRVETEPDLGHAARPQSLDQHPTPIARRGGLVSALQPDHVGPAPCDPTPTGTCAFGWYVPGKVWNAMLSRFQPLIATSASVR